MNFHEWWYDYRIKNQIGENTQKKDIAQAAWLAAKSAPPEEQRIDALMKDIGQYLWEKTERDWILRVHHIPTEPVCPDVWLIEETPDEGKEARSYRAHADTLQEALQKTFDCAKADLESSLPQPHSEKP